MSADLKSIDGGGVKDKARDDLRKLQATIQIVLEAQRAVAQVTRAKYLALIEQGFTAAEALELCK